MLAVGLLTTAAALAERPERGRSRRLAGIPKAGDTVKDFALKDVKGRTIKLSDFRAKSIFVLELGACT